MFTLFVTLVSFILGVITKKLIDRVVLKKTNYTQKDSAMLRLLLGSLGTVGCLVIKAVGTIVVFVC